MNFHSFELLSFEFLLSGFFLLLQLLLSLLSLELKLFLFLQELATGLLTLSLLRLVLHISFEALHVSSFGLR